MKFNKSFSFTVRLGRATRPQMPGETPPAATEALFKPAAPQEPPATPTGGAAEAFKPAASRYRSHRGRFVAIAITGLLISGLSLLVSDAVFPWLAYPGVALVALSLIVFFTLPGLVCPACGRSADGLDAYCPSCGAPGLKRNRLIGTPCRACSKTLGGYKYRNYKIRFCTHCGTLLDSAGV
ncbi:MAG TPA: hypothetical protein VGH16_13065 [Candidatus Binatia bacterium]|jgi:hypothetical protein